MADKAVHTVTGAYGFSGKYIAQRLLEAGHTVRTLTNSLHRANPFGDRIKAFPYSFDKPENLIESLRGTKVLYNNYWVRFNYHRDFTYGGAVENSLVLVDAAKKAGVERIVHVSITNPSEDSPYEYFRGKALVEKAIIGSGISYAILRPAVLFGEEDILINNIAWFLRRFPIFGVFGSGEYRLQPIHVDDLAKLAVDEGQKRENVVINAIGPETFTYRGLVQEIGRIIKKRRLIVPIPPALGYFVGKAAGVLVRDVTITKDEVQGLMDDLLYVDAPPAGMTKLTEWVRERAAIVGSRYHSELARRMDRVSSYEKL
jgi:NADH dehydrogenase